MHRIDTANVQVDKHGAGQDGFRTGTPPSGNATRVDPDFMDALQEELSNAVEDRGATLVKGTNDQLSEALRPIVLLGTGGGSLAGTKDTTLSTSYVTVSGCLLDVPGCLVGDAVRVTANFGLATAGTDFGEARLYATQDYGGTPSAAAVPGCYGWVADSSMIRVSFSSVVNVTAAGVVRIELQFKSNAGVHTITVHNQVSMVAERVRFPSLTVSAL